MSGNQAFINSVTSSIFVFGQSMFRNVNPVQVRIQSSGANWLLTCMGLTELAARLIGEVDGGLGDDTVKGLGKTLISLSAVAALMSSLRNVVSTKSRCGW